MKKPRPIRGLTLVELSVTMALVAILALIGVRSGTKVLREARLTNQLVSLKGAFQQARGRAIQDRVNVLFSFTDDGLLLAIADSNRNKLFNDADDEMILGEGDFQPIDMDSAGVETVADDASGRPVLDHASQLKSDLRNFPNDQFVITYEGLVKDTLGDFVDGTFFVHTRDGLYGAVYISPMGEARIAYTDYQGNWTWSD